MCTSVTGVVRGGLGHGKVPPTHSLGPPRNEAIWRARSHCAAQSRGRDAEGHVQPPL